MALFKLGDLEVLPCEEEAGTFSDMGDVHAMIRYMRVPATLICSDVHGKEGQKQAERGLRWMGEQG